MHAVVDEEVRLGSRGELLHGEHARIHVQGRQRHVVVAVDPQVVLVPDPNRRPDEQPVRRYLCSASRSKWQEAELALRLRVRAVTDES